ncbi:MAG: PepSY domain-containing protein [Bryobacteraceae bacterium]|jgi:hypothetical protein
MIDAKQAIQIAKAKAAEMLDEAAAGVEEIEREQYKDREVWSITLSLPRDANPTPSPLIGQFAADPLQYKRFLIDAETGELLAIKLREVASH